MTLSSYSDITTAVASWLNKSGDVSVTGNAADFVRLAESRIRDDLKTQAQENGNTAFSLSAEFTLLSTITTQFVKLQRIYLTASPNNPLAYYAPDQLITNYPSTAPGQPKAYTIINASIQVRPIPDSTYNAEVDYIKFFDPLATTATNALLTDSPDVYLFGALAEVAAFLGSDKWMGIWDSRYQSAVKRVQQSADDMNLPEGPLVTRTDTGSP